MARDIILCRLVSFSQNVLKCRSLETMKLKEPTIPFRNVHVLFTDNLSRNSCILILQKDPNGPFPNCLLPLFQNESPCKSFLMKMSLICMKINLQVRLIVIEWFFTLRQRELGNGLFCQERGKNEQLCQKVEIWSHLRMIMRLSWQHKNRGPN